MISFCKAMFAVLILPLTISGQTSVPVNVLEYYEYVPAPPATVVEAYARAECSVNGDQYRCDSKAFYATITDKLAALGNRFQEAEAMLTMPAATAMGNVNPEEMQKTMATMSDAEKMQYAMKMMQQTNLGPKALTPESGAVQDALDEYHRVNAVVADEMQRAAAIAEKNSALPRERDRKHREVAAWLAAEVDKLPWVDYSEAGKFKDAKAVHALRTKTMEKHIAVENEYLKELVKTWAARRAELKSRYARLQQKLADAGYGEQARNAENKRLLLGAQRLIVGYVDELLALSRNATDEAVSRWIQKLQVERERP